MEKIKMSKEEIAKIIELHGKWLRGEEGGIKADLSGVDLTGVDLKGVNLHGAYIERSFWLSAMLADFYEGK